MEIKTNTEKNLNINSLSSSNIDITDEAKLNFALDQIYKEAGYRLRIEYLETCSKLTLLNKLGEELNSVLIDDIDSTKVIKVELNEAKKRLEFTFRNNTKIYCDISSLYLSINDAKIELEQDITNINNRLDNISDELNIEDIVTEKQLEAINSGITRKLTERVKDVIKLSNFSIAEITDLDTSRFEIK